MGEGARGRSSGCRVGVVLVNGHRPESLCARIDCGRFVSFERRITMREFSKVLHRITGTTKIVDKTHAIL